MELFLMKIFISFEKLRKIGKRQIATKGLSCWMTYRLLRQQNVAWSSGFNSWTPYHESGCIKQSRNMRERRKIKNFDFVVGSKRTDEWKEGWKPDGEGKGGKTGGQTNAQIPRKYCEATLFSCRVPTSDVNVQTLIYQWAVKFHSWFSQRDYAMIIFLTNKYLI